MKKYSQKALEKRKEERKDFPKFFQKHIQNIKDNNLCCEECGMRLRGDSSEIAHVLPKSTFKSIATNDSNVLYLCGLYSENNCHYMYDNLSNDGVKEMRIFPLVSEKYKELILVLTERLNWKINDRYIKE